MALSFVAAPATPETFNVLLYGQPKSGKSTAAATAPGPIMWLNAEGGGALGYARKTAAARGSEIHEVVIDKRAKDAATILDQVYKHVRDGDAPVVQTVVLDTVGKIRDALIAQMVVPGAKNSLQQFGQVADKLGGFINALRDLPVNLVLLAHADIRDSDEDGRIVLPLIGGKLTETIPGEVDVVAFTAPLTDDEGTRYFGQLIERKGRIAGDRSGALAGERGIRELDLAEWLSTYSAALTPTSEPPAEVVATSEPATPTIDVERAQQLAEIAADLGDIKLQLKATSVHGADVGDCSTVEAATEALSKLTPEQADEVDAWLSQKADELAVAS